MTRTGPQVKRLEWLFVRDNDTVALIKGRVEDIWRRAADGCISFERVFLSVLVGRLIQANAKLSMV